MLQFAEQDSLVFDGYLYFRDILSNAADAIDMAVIMQGKVSIPDPAKGAIRGPLNAELVGDISSLTCGL